MLSKPSPAQALVVSPQISSLSPTLTSMVAPSNADDVPSHNKPGNDLIGLLGKFDINRKPDETHNTPVEKELEEVGDSDDEVSHDDPLHDEAIREDKLSHEDKCNKETNRENHSDNHKDGEKKEVLPKSNSKPQTYQEMTLQPYEIPTTSASEPETTNLKVNPPDSASSSYNADPILSEKHELKPEKDLVDLAGDADLQTSAEENYDTSSPIAVPSPLDTSVSAAIPVRPSRPRINSIKKSLTSINPKDQYQQSHKPFDFQVFLNHLKKKSADPIVRYIRSFLVSFTKQRQTLTSKQKIKIIGDFKLFINEKFELYEPFSSMDSLDLENSREGVEKLIMNRLYDHTFAPEVLKSPSQVDLRDVAAKDVDDDNSFKEQLEKYSWLNGSHLDVDLHQLSLNDESGKTMDFTDYGIKELAKINNYRAPRDKIICILNACKIIFSFLKVSNQETNADAFIPLLIIIIIKSKIPHLISNMHYIENYRAAEWLNHGETSYYLSSLQAAVGFLQNLSFEDLTISQEEYGAHMEAWEAENRNRPPRTTLLQLPAPQRPGVEPVVAQSMSPSNILLTSADMFSKSISNLLSPAPQEPDVADATVQPSHNETAATDEQIRQTYNSLKEVFPTLDRAILKDVVVMNKGSMDDSVDACLQLVG